MKAYLRMRVVDSFKRFNDRYGHRAGDAMSARPLAAAALYRAKALSRNRVCVAGASEGRAVG